MSAAVEAGRRARMSDPRPSYCSACFRGAEDGVRFVDFDAAIDRGTAEELHDGMVWHRESIDDLHLCEACVRDGMETLALRPQAQAKQLREIRRLEKELDGLRAYTRELERTLSDRPDILKRGT